MITKNPNIKLINQISASEQDNAYYENKKENITNSSQIFFEKNDNNTKETVDKNKLDTIYHNSVLFNEEDLLNDFNVNNLDNQLLFKQDKNSFIDNDNKESTYLIDMGKKN